MNFDSPLALGALGGLDLGLDGVGGLGTLHAAGVGGAVQPAEDEKLKRLDTVIDIISVS